jgi:hypothetical protein
MAPDSIALGNREKCMMEIRTKKLPVSLSFGEFKSNSNEFLIPVLKSEERNPSGFMGIKSGKRFPFGALSFLGKAISASDILGKIGATRMKSLDMSAAISDLNSYLEKLQAFKIGNVLEIEYLSNGDIRLIKVAERPPSEKGPKLP